MPHSTLPQRVAAAVGLALAVAMLSGCTVIAVTGAAAGLAVDAAVGAVKLTGAVVGTAVDLAIPDRDTSRADD